MMETTAARSPSKPQHEHSNFLKTAVRHVRTVNLRTRKSRMPREKKHRKHNPRLSEQHSNFEPVTTRHRKTHMCPLLPHINNASNEVDIAAAFASVSDVDVQKYQSVWSFMPPASTKEMKAARREQDVGCLDTNRVIVAVGKYTYIHANYVATPSNPRKFICTQGPLPRTCPEFWCMVVQEEAKAIVMLCNLIEQNTSKCADYYPRSSKKPMTFEGDIAVYCKTNEMFTFPFETSARIEITTLDITVPGMAPHSCVHYHWVDWPDRGVPLADMAPLYFLCQFARIREPVIMHCSAGVSRTGTMVLLQNAMDILARGDVLQSMSVYLDELRAQRSNSVQNENQYLFVHQVLVNYLQKTGWLPQSLDPAIEAFRKSYHKHTKGF